MWLYSVPVKRAYFLFSILILGNVIRNSPQTFLSNHYDDVEAKVQYLLMRMNAPRDTIAELGLLDIDIKELSDGFLFSRNIS